MNTLGGDVHYEAEGIRRSSLGAQTSSCKDACRGTLTPRDCSADRMLRWRDLWEALGEEGLRVRTATGRPPKMSQRQKEKLVRLLLQGPMSFGWRTDVWTTRRIGELIRTKFSIEYHFTQVARILHALHWSPQKPERGALERNEDALERWKVTEWEEIKKSHVAGRLPNFLRREWLPVDSHGAKNLGTCWPHPSDSRSPDLPPL